MITANPRFGKTRPPDFGRNRCRSLFDTRNRRPEFAGHAFVAKIDLCGRHRAAPGWYRSLRLELWHDEGHAIAYVDVAERAIVGNRFRAVQRAIQRQVAIGRVGVCLAEWILLLRAMEGAQ